MDKGVDEEEEEAQRQRSEMEKFASGLDEKQRESERKKIVETEMNIS